MPILELFPKPAQSSDPTETATGAPPPSGSAANQPAASAARATTAGPAAKPPVKVRTGRFGDLEEHELIHLIDTLDDERSRARFRESIYISVIIWLAIGWFLFYGPRVLFHAPQYRDPIALMKQHDQELTLNLPPAPPAPKAPPKIDNKTMEQLKKMEELQRQARQARPTPQPPTPQPEQPPPPQEAHNTAPPVPLPAMPLPAAPRPSPSVEPALPVAPKPNFADNSQSPGDAVRNAARGGFRQGGPEIGAPSTGGPLSGAAQILSDTQGVDFSDYLRRLLSDTKRNWLPLIPQEAEPPILKRGITWIRFTILPDGQLGQPMVLEGPSGDVALDKAAWYAITSEGQYPPLPKAFHGPNLTLRLGFYCNTPLPQ